MILDFENAIIPTSKEDILSKISESEIFERYCKDYDEDGGMFCSSLRDDKHPTCKIYTSSGSVRYKDFGTGDNFNCWGYVMEKFSCTYQEALNIISNDFNISQCVVNMKPKVIVLNDEFKPKPRIEIIKQPWNIEDYKFWSEYGISFELLSEYNVVSVKSVLLYKDKNRYIFESRKNNPKYAYIFYDSTKIYSPYGSKLEKWLYDGEMDNIEGFDQLPDYSEIIILTKSLKDVMCYKTLGVSAISLPSESSRLTNSILGRLRSKCSKLIINLDNDEQGMRATSKIHENYNFKSFYIDKEKDLSDYVKKYGMESARIMINDKIHNECK